MVASDLYIFCLQDFIFSVIFTVGHLAGGVVTAVFAADWATTTFESITVAMAIASVSLVLDIIQQKHVVTRSFTTCRLFALSLCFCLVSWGCGLSSSW